MSGSAKGVTAAKTRGRKYIRNRGYGNASGPASHASVKAAEFIDPQTPVITAIALKTAYDNKYGAPSEGSPKVFLKYFYVNTATGEKSGEMLAMAKLEEEESD